jgi:hypothetical protein
MERRPAAQGLLGPLNLTARCRRSMLEPCLNVSSHRDLAGSWSVDQLEWSLAGPASSHESHLASARDRIVVGLILD